MARSTYIYLVVDRNGDGVALPVFACTVRYELVAWLDRRADWVRAEVRKREALRLVDLLTTPERQYSARFRLRHRFTGAWVTPEQYWGIG